MDTTHAAPAPNLTMGPPVPTAKFAMWVFLASEVMFFTGLIGAYVFLRNAKGMGDWPVPAETLNIPLTGFNTFVLICSSVTMVKALAAALDGDARRMRIYLVATTALGAFFLSVQAYEYAKLAGHGFTPQASLFGSCFYTLTGFHGAHVLGGVITLAVLSILAFRGRVGPHRWAPIEYVGLYWHFVDLVWIILFTIVYLI